MYSRSYNDEIEREVNVPINYDGVAFAEKEREDIYSEAMEESTPAQAIAKNGSGLNLSFLKGLISPDILHSIKMPKIGKEELLLIGTAAFLFFSNDGDKECAIMLILLIFLT